MSTSVDVAIIGAGVAGCIAATALAPNYRVCLIDKREDPSLRVGECLPPAARRILRKCNLLHHFQPIENSPHLVSHGMRSSWGSDQIQVIDHLRNPDGHGWHLDRRLFEKFLRDHCKSLGVQCLFPAQLCKSHFQKPGWQLELTSNENALEISANYVIDATGRASFFAKQQGATRHHEDRLVSCWATLKNDQEMAMGVVAAAPNGWWYIAPLPQGQRILSFQSDSDLIPSRFHENPDTFLLQARENPAIAPWLKTATDLQVHATVPASSGNLNRVVGPSWAAIGDAATSFDPLSSQGMFNGMASAMQLCDLIEKHQMFKDHSDRESAFRTEYQQQIERIWHHYNNHKRFFYGQENRWPDEPFWQRRLGIPST